MRVPVPTTIDRPPRVRADLAVHLSGHHDTQVVTLAGSILLVMPAARIRLTHPQPALAAHTAWRDAMALAADLFGDHGLQSPQPWPDAAVSGHVALSGPVAGAVVDALAAKASPTGSAQIRVRLGGLLVIAADHDAVRCQQALWTTAYRHATELWPTAPESADLADQQFTEAPAFAPIPGGAPMLNALTSSAARQV